MYSYNGAIAISIFKYIEVTVVNIYKHKSALTILSLFLLNKKIDNLNYIDLGYSLIGVFLSLILTIDLLSIQIYKDIIIMSFIYTFYNYIDVTYYQSSNIKKK